MSLALFAAIADEKFSFCGPSTWIFVFIRPSLQKKIRNLLILYLVKNEAMLDVNLCSIKLHELCEFSQKNLLAE